MHAWLLDSQQYWTEPQFSDEYVFDSVDLDMGSLKKIIIDIESSLTDIKPFSDEKTVFDHSAEALSKALIDIESSFTDTKPYSSSFDHSAEAIKNVLIEIESTLDEKSSINDSPDKNSPSLSLGKPLVVASQNSVNTTPYRFNRFHKSNYPKSMSTPKKYPIYGRRLFSFETK